MERLNIGEYNNQEDKNMQVTISDAIRYIGVDDKDIDLFESQYVVPEGVSYNSYLILDEKVENVIDKDHVIEALKNGIHLNDYMKKTED